MSTMTKHVQFTKTLPIVLHTLYKEELDSCFKFNHLFGNLYERSLMSIRAELLTFIFRSYL